MPSEDRLTGALAAVAAAQETFHVAVAEAADQVRALLAASRAPEPGPAARVAGTLGTFADGRIDAERFAALFAGEGVLDERATAALTSALAVLDELAAAGEAAHTVRVPAGSSLRQAVEEALANLGRAFAAARAVEAARGGSATVEDPARPFPFRRWSRAERALAPPLVVEVAGTDLDAGALAAFLDGGQHLVLVVDGPAAPAPLVRLVTPGVLVVQGDEAGALAGWSGPAVAALMPADAAAFTHMPLGGAVPGDRCTVQRWPAEGPRRPVGGWSPAQQAEELAQLRALAAQGAAPAEVPAGEEASAPAQPADKLAAWLLRQTHLSDVA